jgi:hypothetical protein
MNVIEQDSGWAVVADDGSIIKSGFASHGAAWEVPKRNPHERRPRAPDWVADKVGEEIAELASDDAAGGDIAA